jgi:hypothetical protein
VALSVKSDKALMIKVNKVFNKRIKHVKTKELNFARDILVEFVLPYYKNWEGQKLSSLEKPHPVINVVLGQNGKVGQIEEAIAFMNNMHASTGTSSK